MQCCPCRFVPVSLNVDCLPNTANAELSRQPDDVQHVADSDKLDASSLVAMMANTTLQREFESEAVKTMRR